MKPQHNLIHMFLNFIREYEKKEIRSIELENEVKQLREELIDLKEELELTDMRYFNEKELN